ncbi:MAG: hypothetical protein M4D80_19100 [Myxococcota bacterium]|nr:hypothetical protein [Myxococcota bacterium]
MRRIIITALAVMLMGGVASADRGWRSRDTSRDSGGTVVRDHRDTGRVDRHSGYRDRSNYRDRTNYRRVERRPVYVNNGRFVFHGGVSRSYTRPVFRQRYYDYRYRPQIVVQNYDPVPGYTWVQGQWSWSGYEWLWVDGYWAPDQTYQDYNYNYNSGVNVQINGGAYYDNNSGYYNSNGGYYNNSTSNNTYYPTSHAHDGDCGHEY